MNRLSAIVRSSTKSTALNMFGRKNVVVFASGGGNDGLSSIAYIKAHLSRYQFDRIALISPLWFTPFHSNEPIKPGHLNVEPPFFVPTKNMRRYWPCHPPKEFSNMEKMLPETLEEFVPHVKNYLCMSPKYSAVEQAANLRKILEEWNMTCDNTLLNVVDFGGDILTNGQQSTIVSPELDAYTLAVVQNMSDTYLSKVSVCFPGVDGELPKRYLAECCHASEKDLIDAAQWQNVLEKISEKIKINRGRPGNTIPNMISALKKIQDDSYVPSYQLTHKWPVGDKLYSDTRKVDLDLELQRHVHVFDWIDHNPFVSVHNSPNYNFVDVVGHTRKIHATQEIDATSYLVPNGQVGAERGGTRTSSYQASDFSLMYLRKDMEGRWTNRHLVYSEDGERKQEVMIVDVAPTAFSKDNDQIKEDIGLLKTYDKKFSEETSGVFDLNTVDDLADALEKGSKQFFKPIKIDRTTSYFVLKASAWLKIINKMEDAPGPQKYSIHLVVKNRGGVDLEDTWFSIIKDNEDDFALLSNSHPIIMELYANKMGDDTIRDSDAEQLTIVES